MNTKRENAERDGEKLKKERLRLRFRFHIPRAQWHVAINIKERTEKEFSHTARLRAAFTAYEQGRNSDSREGK
jgi:hypothetical protein